MRDATPTQRIYLTLFRPVVPALTSVAFLVAWAVVGSDQLLDVAIGTSSSAVAALVYLVLARWISPLRVIAGSLVVDELIVLGLVLQLPDPVQVATALLWSVALAGLFLATRAVLLMTGFAVALFLALPLLSDSDPSASATITEALVIVVIGGVLAFARNEELRLRRELTRSQRQLNEAQRVAAIGSWEWHPDSDTLAWSDETYRLMGLDPSSPVTQDAFHAVLDPEERDRMQAAITQTLDEGHPYDIDMRFRRPDGTQGVLRARGATIVHEGERWFVGTVQDVTELRHVQSLQAEFVATASHELRTPTTIIAGFARTLADRWDLLDEESRRGFVEHIQTGADRLTNLIEDVLHVSRIETGQLRLTPEPFDLQALVRDTLNERGGVVAGTVVHPIGPDEPVHVQADPQRVRQVLDNVLENAGRYADSRVTVTVGHADGLAVLTVEDDGPGIELAHRERIFERFTRLEPAGRSTPGTGLGLYIARELVERSGGSIAAGASERLGGAAVSFTLPLAT